MKSNQDEKFMREAIKEAKKALKRGDWPIGAVVILDNKVISRASNRRYTSGKIFDHAEILALKKANGVLAKEENKCILYTTCEPCPMCFGAAIMGHIRRIVFGIKENAGATHFKDYLPSTFLQKKYQIDIKGGVLADECWKVFVAGKPTQKLAKNNLLLKEYK